MKTHQLDRNGPSVSAIGLGCMSMTDFYTTDDDRQKAITTLHRAVELGLNFFDTADMYDPHSNKELFGEALRGKHKQVFLASKFGIIRDPANPQTRDVDDNPAYIRHAIKGSLKRLGTSRLGLYYQHHTDPQVPIGDSVGTLADLVKISRIRHTGLSEASAETLEHAHRVHPVSALQSEYSLWTRDPEDTGVPAACYHLDVAFIPYNLPGQGFPTDTLKRPEDSTADDYRHFGPRLQGESFAKNLKLVNKVGELTTVKGVKPSQPALTWVLAQDDDLIPVPGTKQRRYLEENAAATELRLSAAESAEPDAIFPTETVADSRYSGEGMCLVSL